MQPSGFPGSVVPFEPHPVVEPVGPSLPELDGIDLNSKPTPEIRQRNGLVLKALTYLPLPLLKFRTAFKSPALTRCPGTNLASAITAVEVLFRLLPGYRGDRPFDANLALQHDPMEHGSGPGITPQFFTFAAFVVGVEHNAAVLDFLEQYHAGGGMAVRRAGRQAHGFREHKAGFLSGGEPFAEQDDRVAFGDIAGQAGQQAFAGGESFTN